MYNYVSRERWKGQYKEKYIPLEFDLGQDAQMDWCEAEVILAGERVTLQLFILRLNYSKARFVMAFPFQKQEAFFEGHNPKTRPSKNGASEVPRGLAMCSKPRE